MANVTVVEDLYHNLEFIDATRRGWRARVLHLIGHTEPPTMRPLLSVLDVAAKLGVRTVILEHEYVCADFLDEFQHYYCRRFADIQSKCIRLHFFSASFGKAEFPLRDSLSEEYLGFTVVRPTYSYRTGRTALRSPRDDSNSMYTLGKVKIEANLLGHSLSIQGMPFMQQDTNVCICAEAALWMTSLYMHLRFGAPQFMPSQITTAATRALTVGPVRRGLIPEQVLAALREMGYQPLIFTHYDVDITSRIIYAYVESEMPTILLLRVGGQGHAVVAIGHDFHVRRKPKFAWRSNIHWIDSFYIHDDADGPYRQLLVRRRRAGIYSVHQHAAYVMVPVEHDVSMQANDVFDHLEILKEHINDIIGLFEDGDLFCFSRAELRGLIFRTYLRLSNDFKTGLSSQMSQFFRHCCRSLRMPRYLWVTEISMPHLINISNAKDRRIVGEIVMDATSDRHSAMTSYLAIHLHGRMIVKRPTEQQPYALYLDPSEKPYSHLVR